MFWFFFEVIGFIARLGLTIFLLVTFSKAFGTLHVKWEKKDISEEIGGIFIFTLFFFPSTIMLIAIIIQDIACDWIMNCYQYDQYGHCVLYEKKEFGSLSSHGVHYGLYNPDE